MGGGRGFVFELIGQAGGGEGLGFGFDDGCACFVDALEGFSCGDESFGLQQVGEFGEGELVEVAEVEGGGGRGGRPPPSRCARHLPRRPGGGDGKRHAGDFVTYMAPGGLPVGHFPEF